ncbi:uncharacterized protein LOC128324941 isoform X2 [Hemicordylus capensis]|uniref:uncharacterized protein LOC128324941 isoform X2 n=1 Tax=Hemicordylus capensis TaxID=884348 RepID=UPI00230319B7|nr:uncharacterized protein LOC128324941 isoform X2 [Hemicordylus capensis]
MAGNLNYLLEFGLSQEKILKIMKMVKNKELSVEEALDLAEREKSIEEKEEKSPTLLVYPQDLPNCSQFNFSVYKYKHYRWQKRILQIDLHSKTIFNIEKGIMKKQFPFPQVKSCAYGEGRRFRISFHEHQDYELEAASLDDKNKITQLMSKVIQSNACEGLAEPSYGQPGPCDVIHEGLLDLQLEMATSVQWVKHFVQLRDRELSLHCIDQHQKEMAGPVTKTINLSSGDAIVSEEEGCGRFSLQAKEAKYLFQIPFTVQNNKVEDISKLRNEWLMLIDRSCSLPKASMLTQDDASEDAYEKMHALKAEEMEEPPSRTAGPPTTPKAVTLVHTPQEDSSSVLAMTPLPVMITNKGLPPPLPKSSNPSAVSTRTKNFHWDVIPQEKIQKSMWTSCPGKKNIDVARLYDQFRIQQTAGFPGNEPLVISHIMLNQKVAHNFNIFLKSFRIKPSQLKEKLYIIHEDSGGLSDEQITALRRYQPTAKDIEMYQSFKGSPSELHLVDQFMLEMCKIPNLGQKLDLLLSVRELPSSMADLEPLINQKIRACKELQDSSRFVAVLQYILTIGNYLNEKGGRESAKGFLLSSLAKLSLLRGKERNFTLLHALVEQIFLHEPDLAKFSQELTEFKAVSGASIKGLSAEVEVLRKELESIVECRRLIKPKVIKAGTLESHFHKDLKDLIQKYEGELLQLSKRCAEMKKAYHDILMKFAEAEDRDSEELFGWIATFISEFKRVSLEIMP